jgi:hypothetical protein
MKTFFMILVLVLLSPILLKSQTNSDTLTNETIIQLTKIGLQPSVIINKINASVDYFNVSTNALVRLSDNKVSPEVINEMMKVAGNNDLARENSNNLRDPNQMHKSGIYYYNSQDPDNPLKKIQVVRITNFASGGGGYGGFGGTSTSAVVSGEKSKQQIVENNPIFYFYFNPEQNVKADWFEGAASPNEFSLVKMVEKRDKRLFKVSSGSSFSYGSHASVGIPEKTKIDFQFDEIRDGIFKVSINKPLPSGEYCFVFAAEMSKVFDFGIQK